MQQSQELVKKAGIVPRLVLATKEESGATISTGPHRVKILSEKIVKGIDYQTQQERHEMEYIFEENGEKKTYNVALKDKQGQLHYLIQRFAEIEPGTELILEVKRKGIKNYVDVIVIGGFPTIPEAEDIPVVNAEEPPFEEEV